MFIFHLMAQDSQLTRDKCTNQPPHLVSADKNLSSYDWPLLMDSHAHSIADEKLE